MPEITFSSVKDAVRWSEEVALSPGIQSSMKLLYSAGGKSILNQNEAVDIAQTITHITENCKPYKGMAIRAIYSRPNKDIDHILGIVIASKLLTMDSSKGKTITQLVTLGTGIVKALRAVELYNGRYPVSRQAKDVGVSRERFCKGKCWVILRSEAKQQLKRWVELAEIDIYCELNIRGWIS